MNDPELVDIEARVARLTAEEQLYLIERLLRNIRLGAYSDPAAAEKSLRDMAADPDIQRDLRAIESDFSAPRPGGLEKAG